MTDTISREQLLADVDRYLDSFPPHLAELAMLLKQDMAASASPTGQLYDLFTGATDPPLLTLHTWLLDDFAVPGDERRVLLERHVWLSMFFAAAAILARESICSELAALDARAVVLAQLLAQESSRHLALIFPVESALWPIYHSCWGLHAESAVADHTPVSGEEGLRRAAGRLAPLKIPAAAAALAAERSDLLPRIMEILDDVCVVLQVLHDVSTIRRDIQWGRQTYPVVRALQAAGMASGQPATPDGVLAALMLTGVVAAIGRECLARLDACKTIASEVCLPSLSAYCERLAGPVREMIGLFSLRPQQETSQPATSGSSLMFAPPINALDTAIKMAEGYLLADLTFRESWEIQRQGLLGKAEVIGRPFPAGSIIELLCREGHKLGEQVDEIAQLLAANGYRYFDHPGAVLPDIDDLGLLLRLVPYAADPQTYRELLQPPLRLLESQIGESGAIPVWLTEGDAPAHLPGVILWGADCIATQANLLLGLIAYDWAAYQGQIERSAAHIFGRYLDSGLGANHYYIPLYAQWILLTLARQLNSRPVSASTAAILAEAQASLAARLDQECRRPAPTPQDAALLALAYSSIDLPLSPAWRVTLIKSQRYDGSWAAEPLYITGTRGGLATWYSSRSFTTALCYRALKAYAREGAQSS